MRWYSPKNEKTFDKYMKHVQALGLREKVKGKFVDADEVSVYNILFLVRSHSDKHHFHLDWSEELGTQSITFLVPLNNFSIHMKYYDNDDELQKYEYKMGKGVGFGGGFMHSSTFMMVLSNMIVLRFNVSTSHSNPFLSSFHYRS